MNTYELLGDTRGLPTQIPTQNNRYAKLACARSCCSNKRGKSCCCMNIGSVLYGLSPVQGTYRSINREYKWVLRRCWVRTPFSFCRGFFELDSDLRVWCRQRRIVSLPAMKRRISHDQWSQQSRVLDKRCAHIRRRTIITSLRTRVLFHHSRHNVCSNSVSFAGNRSPCPTPHSFLQASSSKSSSTTSWLRVTATPPGPL